MFDSLNSNCKTQINIINGGHCYFAMKMYCVVLEIHVTQTVNILRAEQQSVTNDFLKIWSSILKRRSKFTIFNDSLQSSSGITYSQA